MRKLFAWIIEHIIAKIHIPFSRKLSPEEMDFFRMENLRGCILLTYTPYQLSNWGIKGEYTHCELIVNDDYCAGATTSGVDLHLISNTIKKASRYAVLMPKELDVQERGKLVIEAVAQTELDIEYDYEFTPNNKKFYCSEFIIFLCKKTLNYILDYGKYIHPFEFKEDKRFICIKEFKC